MIADCVGNKNVAATGAKQIEQNVKAIAWKLSAAEMLQITRTTQFFRRRPGEAGRAKT